MCLPAALRMMAPSGSGGGCVLHKASRRCVWLRCSPLDRPLAPFGFLMEESVGEQLRLLTAEEESSKQFFGGFLYLIFAPPGLRMSLSWCVCLPLWMLHGRVEAGAAFGPRQAACVSLVCCIQFFFPKKQKKKPFPIS